MKKVKVRVEIVDENDCIVDSADYNYADDSNGLRRLWKWARSNFSSKSSVSTNSTGSCEYAKTCSCTDQCCNPNACPCGYTDGCSARGNAHYTPENCKYCSYPYACYETLPVCPIYKDRKSGYEECWNCGYPGRIEPCPFQTEHDRINESLGRPPRKSRTGNGSKLA